MVPTHPSSKQQQAANSLLQAPRFLCDSDSVGGPSLLLQLQGSNWWRLKCDQDQWNAAHEFSWVPGNRSRPRKSAKCFEPVWCHKLFQGGSGESEHSVVNLNAMICNDMQWYAMAWTGVLAWISLVPGHCIRTHAHAVFEECQVFLKYACFIIIVMHFLTVSSIFFIASFHHISIYIICDRIYINLRYYMLTRMDLWLIDYPWLLYTVEWCWHVDCAKHWQAGAFCSRALKAPLWTASARRTAAQRELQRVLKDNSNDLSTDSKMF